SARRRHSGAVECVHDDGCRPQRDPPPGGRAGRGGRARQKRAGAGLHEVGGGQTEGMLVRTIARYAGRSEYARPCARVEELTRAGWSLHAIAHQLEAEGSPPLRSGQGWSTWSTVSIQTVRRQVGLGDTHRHDSSRAALGPHEWWATD